MNNPFNYPGEGNIAIVNALEAMRHVTDEQVETYVASNGITYPKRFASCPQRLYALRIKSGFYRVDAGQLHKRCSKCRDHWPADTEFFYASTSTRDGLFDWCKACYQQWRYPNGRKRNETKNRIPQSDYQ